MTVIDKAKQIKVYPHGMEVFRINPQENYLHQHADCDEFFQSYLPAGGILPEVTECCCEPVVNVVEGQLLVGSLQNSLEQRP